MHQIRPSHLTLFPQIKEQAVRAFAGGSEKKKKLFGKASGGTGKSFGDLARKAVTQDRAAAPTAAVGAGSDEVEAGGKSLSRSAMEAPVAALFAASASPLRHSCVSTYKGGSIVMRSAPSKRRRRAVSATRAPWSSRVRPS